MCSAVSQSKIKGNRSSSCDVSYPRATEHLELIPLELINSNRDAIRKAREAFLIYKAKTLEPSGMNRRDEI